MAKPFTQPSRHLPTPSRVTPPRHAEGRRKRALSSPPNAAPRSPPPAAPRRRRRRGGDRSPIPYHPHSHAASAAAQERDPRRAPPAVRPAPGRLPVDRHRLLARRQRQPHRRPRGALLRPLRLPHLLPPPRHGGAPLRLTHRPRGRPGPPVPLLVHRPPHQGRPAPAAALRLPRHRVDHAQAPRRRLPVHPLLRGIQPLPPLLRARRRRQMVPGLLCPILGDGEGPALHEFLSLRHLGRIV